jgi:hypothetical protein
MIDKLIDRLKKGPRYRYRSAETGRYVSWLFAKLNPSTTIRERVR